MKAQNSNLHTRIGLFTALLLAIGATSCTTSQPKKPTLKSAYKHDFYVGVAINRDVATGTQALGDFDSRTLEQINQDTALVKQQFNQLSPENDLKWAGIHPEPGPDGYNFGPADAYVNFGLSNHMYIVGHTLIWHGSAPNWIFQATNSPRATNAPSLATNATASAAGTNAPGVGRGGRGGRGFGRGGFGGGFGRGRITGPLASREQVLQRMHDHIFTVVGRYKGKIKVWDVVNEAISDGGTNILRDSYWTQTVGPDFIAKAFEYAHEADPKAILRYNDYSLENPGKRKKLIALIKSLRAQGVPVMAIGSQTHVSVTGPSFEEEDKTLTELETLGLPIHITEFDVNGAQGGQRNTSGDVASNAAATQGGLVSNADQKLADAYERLFRAFVKHRKSVKVVTFWDVNDAVSWRASGHPLLFDGNDQPKPAFDAVIRAAKPQP